MLDDKYTSVERVTKRIEEGFDLFFNLCDGAEDQESPGVEVVQTLEKHKVPFTGATSEFFEPTRKEQKAACRKLGIATPRWAIARTELQIERAAERLNFPLFVKHYSSYSSIDLSRHSKAVTPAGLRRQANKIISKHGAALIEEYIEGTECTVLVAENPDNPRKPISYTPIQYRFPEGDTFKHSDLKWEDYSGLSAEPVEDPELAQRMRDESARFFVELNGASFGRCDIRVDQDGVPHMLEINPNCGLYYPPADAASADLILMLEESGHAGFTELLVRSALKRHRRRAVRKHRRKRA